MSRTYKKVKRAEAEAETRNRIVDALLSLHEEVGPSRTTISAVAERAGVERLTVYRHFGSELEMLQACTHRWSELNPPPGIPAITHASPLAVAQATLRRMYRWYQRNAQMLIQISSDLDRVEAVREMYAPVEAYLDQLAESLNRRWPRRSTRRRATLRHALEFNTWRSLARLSRSNRRAAAIAASWLERSPRE